MKWTILISFFVFILGCKTSQYLQRNKVQLSKPMIQVNDLFFEDQISIVISPSARDADIVYSVSGGVKKSYEEPIPINESSKIVTQCVGGDYLASDSMIVEVLKMPKNEMISIETSRQMHEKYGDEGLDILIDRSKEEREFDKGWIGYLGDTVVFDLNFDFIEIDHLIISTLKNQRAWIFSPKKINVYYNEEKVASYEFENADEKSADANVFTKISLPKIEVNQLKIEIIALKGIPNWHVGKESPPWFFIDEILIY